MEETQFVMQSLSCTSMHWHYIISRHGQTVNFKVSSLLPPSFNTLLQVKQRTLQTSSSSMGFIISMAKYLKKAMIQGNGSVIRRSFPGPVPGDFDAKTIASGELPCDV